MKMCVLVCLKKKKKGWASEFETIVELSKRGASFGSVEENVVLPA